MASEPTDLIREATAALDGNGIEARLLSSCRAESDALDDLVRRLRDALAEKHTGCGCRHCQRQFDAMVVALAEANATIEKVRKIVDDPTLKDYAALAAVRRAIEGPAT